MPWGRSASRQTAGFFQRAAGTLTRMEYTKQQTMPSSISGNIEKNVAPEPVNSSVRTALLATAGASMLASLIMHLTNRKPDAMFVGQWAPTLVAAALWYQIVKSQR